MKGSKARLLIVDAQPVFREGLAVLLRNQSDMEVVGQAGGAKIALQQLEQTEVDCVVMDHLLQDGSGLELVRRMRDLRQAVTVIIFSAQDETLYAERALRAGARGYLMKSEAPEMLISGIRRALAGELVLSPPMTARLLESFIREQRVDEPHELALLSDRELEVFRLFGQGLTTREISQRLNLGMKTIGTYAARLKRKLHLPNHERLIQAAAGWLASTESGSSTATTSGIRSHVEASGRAAAVG